LALDRELSWTAHFQNFAETLIQAGGRVLIVDDEFRIVPGCRSAIEKPE
jgi:hypothetical protein